MDQRTDGHTLLWRCDGACKSDSHRFRSQNSRGILIYHLITVLSYHRHISFPTLFPDFHSTPVLLFYSSLSSFLPIPLNILHYHLLLQPILFALPAYHYPLHGASDFSSSKPSLLVLQDWLIRCTFCLSLLISRSK